MPRPEKSADQLLIEKTLAGDQDAFAAIVQKYQRKIFRTALAIVRDETEAEVATHETFVQGYIHLRKFEGRSELETWLTRIVINKCRDSLRRRRWVSISAPEDDDDQPYIIEPMDEAPDAERRASSKELSRAIENAVEGLSTQQKLIFRLRHFEERSLEEIAVMLNVRAGTVRAHLFRAVHKVREQLAAWARPEALEESDEAL